MTSAKAALLLNTIVAHTEDGTIPWTATSTDNAFEASLQRSTIRIVKEEGETEDGEEYTLCYIEILNDDGRVIDAIRPYEVRELIDNPWEVTKSLFTQAKDRALGIDETIDGILAELGAVALPKSDEDEIPF